MNHRLLNFVIKIALTQLSHDPQLLTRSLPSSESFKRQKLKIEFVQLTSELRAPKTIQLWSATAKWSWNIKSPLLDRQTNRILDFLRFGCVKKGSEKIIELWKKGKKSHSWNSADKSKCCAVSEDRGGDWCGIVQRLASRKCVRQIAKRKLIKEKGPNNKSVFSLFLLRVFRVSAYEQAIKRKKRGKTE